MRRSRVVLVSVCSAPRTVQQHQLAVVQHHDPVQQHGLQAQRKRDAWLYERLAAKADGQGEAAAVFAFA